MDRPQPQPSENVQPAPADNAVGRFLCFLIISTVGMATIAIALLAEPMAGFYLDQALICEQRNHLAKMEKLLSQQQELLANANNPSVMARAAIFNLNYVPVESATGATARLPAVWLELQRALETIDKKESAPAKPTTWEILAKVLAQQQLTQIILLALGGSLVVISLTFFYRRG